MARVTCVLLFWCKKVAWLWSFCWNLLNWLKSGANTTTTLYTLNIFKRRLKRCVYLSPAIHFNEIQSGYSLLFIKSMLLISFHFSFHFSLLFPANLLAEFFSFWKLLNIQLYYQFQPKRFSFFSSPYSHVFIYRIKRIL